MNNNNNKPYYSKAPRKNKYNQKEENQKHYPPPQRRAERITQINTYILKETNYIPESVIEFPLNNFKRNATWKNMTPEDIAYFYTKSINTGNYFINIKYNGRNLVNAKEYTDLLIQASLEEDDKKNIQILQQAESLKNEKKLPPIDEELSSIIFWVSVHFRIHPQEKNFAEKKLFEEFQSLSKEEKILYSIEDFYKNFYDDQFVGELIYDMYKQAKLQIKLNKQLLREKKSFVPNLYKVVENNRKIIADKIKITENDIFEARQDLKTIEEYEADLVKHIADITLETKKTIMEQKDSKKTFILYKD